MSRKKGRLGARIAAAVTLVALGAVGYFGWSWLDGLVCSRVAVDGYRYADVDEILAVARVDMGARLLDIQPEMIADRVERHPWIERASVRRLPPGTVAIHVRERVPVALAIDAQGVPSMFLDAEGYALPALPEAVFDVPLIRGVRIPENPTQRVETAAVRDLLAALAQLEEHLNALVSTFEVGASGDITLYTVPAAGRGAIPVKLGRAGFTEKLNRLWAFWEQAVISRPELTFELIDLRFDGQIVTRES